MEIDAGLQLLAPGDRFASPGGRFAYEVLGPVCRLFDREELPWPCCSLTWRGKAPSWNRQGRRFVADLAASRSPSYRVAAMDGHGVEWQEDRTLYQERLGAELRDWWITRKPAAAPWPSLPPAAVPDRG